MTDKTQKLLLPPLERGLWAKILAGMVAGIAIGMVLSPHGLGIWDADWAFAAGKWIALPGVIFLGLIQMVIIPLIICSIVLGIAEGKDLGFVKRIALRLIPYFVITTALAITIGITLVNIFKPGLGIDPDLAQSMLRVGATNVPTQTFGNLSIPDRIANLIPTNPAKASLDRDMLQIVIASMILGVALLTLPVNIGKPFRDLCMSGQALCMKIIGWAMHIAPLAVFGLLCNVTIQLGLDALTSMASYTLTVLAGLLCVLAIYLVLITLFTRTSPLTFLKQIRDVQLIAFSTSSSAATMPFSMQVAETRLGAHPEIGRFVIPLGATINMDGTALYQGVAAVFLCQVFGVDLSLGETILLILTTVGASIGTPATPGVGLIVLTGILTGVGVPAEGIGLIIGVDRLLDMCRTTINVTGDLTATKIMDRWMQM